MWQSIASIFYITVRGVAGISKLVSWCLNVLIAGLICIARIYRFGARVFAECMVDRRRIVAGTGEAGRS